MRTKTVYYNGSFYKSLLDAQWAAFFENMQIEFKYGDDKGFFLSDQNILIYTYASLEQADQHEHNRTRNTLATYVLVGFPEILIFTNMRFGNTYIQEPCNFGIYLLEMAPSNKIVRTDRATVNMQLMEVLGWKIDRMKDTEHFDLTKRFCTAVKAVNNSRFI